MTSVFPWQTSTKFCPASFWIPRPNLPVTPSISSYFCIPVPYNENYISIYIYIYILVVSSRRSCRSSQNHLNSASSALLVRSQIWITVILNGLPWKRTVIMLLSLRLHPSTAFQTLVDYDGYSISSKGFLPTVVDIMVI